MSQQLEIELKNSLTKNEFERLGCAFGLKQSAFREQTNFYIDTPSFALKDYGVALRIRKKNDQFELTLKEPYGEGLLETTDQIEPQNIKEVKSFDQLEAPRLLTFFRNSFRAVMPMLEVTGQLKKYKIGLNDLVVFGSLRTVRAEVEYEDGLLVFDQSFYFDKVDYELEYEVTNLAIGQAHFTELLAQHAIPVRPSENKIKRFYKEKKRLDRGKSS